MDLQEAIAHLKERLAQPWDCEECKHKHELLLDWLEELRTRRMTDRWIPTDKFMPQPGDRVLVSDGKNLCEADGSVAVHRPDMVKFWHPLPGLPVEAESYTGDDVGTRVYIYAAHTGAVCEYRITSTVIRDGVLWYRAETTDPADMEIARIFPVDDFGKTVFCTRALAEAVHGKRR